MINNNNSGNGKNTASLLANITNTKLIPRGQIASSKAQKNSDQFYKFIKILNNNTDANSLVQSNSIVSNKNGEINIFETFLPIEKKQNEKISTIFQSFDKNKKKELLVDSIGAYFLTKDNSANSSNKLKIVEQNYTANIGKDEKKFIVNILKMNSDSVDEKKENIKLNKNNIILKVTSVNIPNEKQNKIIFEVVDDKMEKSKISIAKKVTSDKENVIYKKKNSLSNGLNKNETEGVESLLKKKNTSDDNIELNSEAYYKKGNVKIDNSNLRKIEDKQYYSIKKDVQKVNVEIVDNNLIKTIDTNLKKNINSSETDNEIKVDKNTVKPIVISSETSSFVHPALKEINDIISSSKFNETIFLQGSKLAKIINGTNSLVNKPRIDNLQISKKAIVDDIVNSKNSNSIIIEINPQFLKNTSTNSVADTKFTSSFLETSNIVNKKYKIDTILAGSKSLRSVNRKDNLFTNSDKKLMYQIAQLTNVNNKSTKLLSNNIAKITKNVEAANNNNNNNNNSIIVEKNIFTDKLTMKLTGNSISKEINVKNHTSKIVEVLTKEVIKEVKNNILNNSEANTGKKSIIVKSISPVLNKISKEIIGITNRVNRLQFNNNEITRLDISVKVDQKADIVQKISFKIIPVIKENVASPKASIIQNDKKNIGKVESKNHFNLSIKNSDKLNNKSVIQLTNFIRSSKKASELNSIDDKPRNAIEQSVGIIDKKKNVMLSLSNKLKSTSIDISNKSISVKEDNNTDTTILSNKPKVILKSEKIINKYIRDENINNYLEIKKELVGKLKNYISKEMELYEIREKLLTIHNKLVDKNPLNEKSSSNLVNNQNNSKQVTSSKPSINQLNNNNIVTNNSFKNTVNDITKEANKDSFTQENSANIQNNSKQATSSKPNVNQLNKNNTIITNNSKQVISSKPNVNQLTNKNSNTFNHGIDKQMSEILFSSDNSILNTIGNFQSANQSSVNNFYKGKERRSNAFVPTENIETINSKKQLKLTDNTEINDKSNGVTLNNSGDSRITKNTNVSSDLTNSTTSLVSNNTNISNTNFNTNSLPTTTNSSNNFTTVEKVKFMEKLIKGFTHKLLDVVNQGKAKNSLLLSLNPQKLGKIKIEIVKLRDSFKLEFQFSKKDTKAMMQESKEKLLDTLKDNGVEVKKIDMKLYKNNDSLIKFANNFKTFNNTNNQNSNNSENNNQQNENNGTKDNNPDQNPDRSQNKENNRSDNQYFSSGQDRDDEQSKHRGKKKRGNSSNSLLDEDYTNQIDSSYFARIVKDEIDSYEYLDVS